MNEFEKLLELKRSGKDSSNSQKDKNSLTKKQNRKRKTQKSETKVKDSLTKNENSSLGLEKKILEISSLWSEMCDLKADFGMKSLLCLLSKKRQYEVLKLSKNKVAFSRTPAATAIIKLYRHLKAEGFE